MPDPVIRVVACLAGDEPRADGVLVEAARLARDMGASLHRADDPRDWFLEPVSAYTITHLMFGPAGWRRWREDLMAMEQSGRLALPWQVGIDGRCFGFSFESDVALRSAATHPILSRLPARRPSTLRSAY